jgi:NADH-quinone oxidoreductase subunit J
VTGPDVVFLLVGLATAATAVLTVTSKNLVHAALFLAATLAGIAAEFLVLQADFVAWVQIVVYVGAIAVLFLFGLMLTRAPIGREALDSQNKGLGLAVSGAMFVVLLVLIIDGFGGVSVELEPGARIADLGLAIFSTWVFPFELLSMLLLGALIGAILLSRREDGESGTAEAPNRVLTGDVPSAELEVDERRALAGDSTRALAGDSTPGGDQ